VFVQDNQNFSLSSDMRPIRKSVEGISLISELVGFENLFLALCAFDHFAGRRQSYRFVRSSISSCTGEFVLCCRVEEAIRNLSRYEK
jgi:hypothetical protein